MSRQQASIFEAETVAAALRRAETELACEPAQLKHRVLQSPSRGFFGFGRRPARIEAWVKAAVSAPVAAALDAVRVMDGHCQVEVRESELWLAVFAPRGGGKPVTAPTAIAAVRQYEPKSLDEAAIGAAVAAANGEARLAGRLDPRDNRNGGCRLEVSADGMLASVSLTPPRLGGREITPEEIRQELDAAGIRAAIDMNMLRQACEEKRFLTPLPVARGRPPIAGEPGRLEFLFRADRHTFKFREDEHGRVNYRELELIENVARGQTLLKRHQPTAGQPGEDVRGRAVPAATGKPVELPGGKNLERDYDEIRAAIDGHVTWTGSQVNVMPILSVRGDVNMEVGNLDFEGTVRIDGMVEDGFTVKSGGSVFVRKSLGKCRIEAQENLVVMGGILGRHEAEIRAGGDIVALFIENAKVFAGRNLNIGELILHSEIMCGGDLVLTGARGALIGGSITAGGNVAARVIGGEGTSRTSVTAGVPPDLIRRLQGLQAQRDELEEKLDKVTIALAAIQRGAAAAGAAAEGQLTAASESLKAQLRGLKSDLRHAEEEIGRAGRDAMITVSEVAQAGTRIEIGGVFTILSAPVKFATFRRVGREIKFEPYHG